jgi:hypothetical protein
MRTSKIADDAVADDLLFAQCGDSSGRWSLNRIHTDCIGGPARLDPCLGQGERVFPCDAQFVIFLQMRCCSHFLWHLCCSCHTVWPCDGRWHSKVSNQTCRSQSRTTKNKPSCLLLSMLRSLPGCNCAVSVSSTC